MDLHIAKLYRTMKLCYLLLFWSLLELTYTSNSSLMQAAVTQIVYDIENNIFRASRKCDLYILGAENIRETINFETLDNPVILMNAHKNVQGHENLNEIVRRNSHCLILLMTLKNSSNTDMNLIKKIVGPIKDSIVISISLSNAQVEDIWSNQMLDRFPRNILKITENKLKMQISLDIICVQNLDHVIMQNVNLWASRKSPVNTLTETMPNHVCPHPLYRKKLRAGYFVLTPSVLPKQSAEYGLGGFEISLLKLLKEKFQFEMSFLKDAIGQYNTSTKKWTGMFGMLLDDELDLRISTCAPRSIYDYTRLILYAEFKWISRKPIPIKKYDQFLIPFSKSVWAATLSTLLVLSVLFALFYKIYKGQSFNGHGLTGYLATPVDFFLITISALMEPDPMSWFPKFSAGRLLVLLWCILSLNFNNFYVCNLRAALMRQDYEKQIDAAADVVQRDQAVHMPLSTYNAFFKNQKLENPNLQKIISLVLDRKSLYDNVATNDLPEAVRKSIFNKGSILMGASQGLLARSFTDKAMSPEKLHVGKETILGFNIVYCLKKDTTWRVDFDRILGRAYDMGIIEHFIRKELPPNAYMPAPKRDASDEVMPIKLEQIISMVFFLCIGFGISIIAMIFELLKLVKGKKIN